MTATAIQKKDFILESLANGVHVDDVAKSLGIAHSNISKHLANDPDYKLAREIGTEVRLNTLRRNLSSVRQAGFQDGIPVGLDKDKGTLARVCYLELQGEQWFAEREFDRWKPKSDIKQEVTHKLQLDDAELARRVASLMQSRGLVIEGSAETVVDQQVITDHST